jgi:beta-galactosidase
LVNSDHTPNAGLLEYKKAIEPVQLVESTKSKAKFINRYDLITLDHLACLYSTTSDVESARASGRLTIPSGVAPGQTFELDLPEIPNTTGEVLLNISFTQRESTPHLPSGFEIANAQISLTPYAPLQPPPSSESKLEVTPSRNLLTISAPSTTWTFNTLHGTLTSWRKNSTDILTSAPELSIFRAPTDNDAPQDGWDWNDKHLHLARPSTRKVEWSQSAPDTLVVTVHQRLAPPILSWSIESILTYTFRTNGSVSISVSGTPKGANLPRTLPRIGLVMGMPHEFQGVEWFGRGPGESYRDSKLSQLVGKYNAASVDEMWVDYEVPQESSNHTDTRWVTLSNPSVSLLAQFVGKGESERKLFDFQVSHYNMRDVAKAGHPHELRAKKREDVLVRLDAAHHGLGSGSCGPRTRDEYALLMGEFEFEVLLQTKE